MCSYTAGWSGLNVQLSNPIQSHVCAVHMLQAPCLLSPAEAHMSLIADCKQLSVCVWDESASHAGAQPG